MQQVFLGGEMIIDRIEGSLAVVEFTKDEFQDVPLDKIAGRARDGAVLKEDGHGGYVVDEDATERRASRAKSRLHGLFSRK